MKKRVLSKTSMYLIIFAVLVIVVVLFLILGKNDRNTGLLILKDKMLLPEDKCKLLDQYVIIYQTGCSHCAKVLPRIQEVEKDLNITFKHYNLALKQDFNELNAREIMPEGVPCVIIDCHAYLGDPYSTEDYKNFVLNSS